MREKVIGFIGFGLIGGSIARGLKRQNKELKIMAYMRTRSKLEQAKADGIVDVILDGVCESLRECDIIFLCTPVEYNAQYLAQISPYLKEGAFITDVGSTKTGIHEEVIRQGLEDRFIGGHPMAGSEKTGYENASDHLLENAYYIITKTAKAPDSLKERLWEVALALGAIPMELDYREHDRVVAAVSHLPHLIASSLVNLVRDSDNEAGVMRQIAAGGFKDITRIASASPEMWQQICLTNRQPIVSILTQYIDSLREILSQVEKGDPEALYRLFEDSRRYRNSLPEKAKGSVDPDYSFTVDIVDEPGAISTLSVILAAKGISIKNIGINHNREHGEGALRINFYEKEAMDSAREQLTKYHYALWPLE